jgi:hypothetical protein
VSPLAPAARLVILTAVSCRSADYVTLLFQPSTNTTFNNVAIAIERTASNFLCRAIFLAATVAFARLLGEIQFESKIDREVEKKLNP